MAAITAISKTQNGPAGINLCEAAGRLLGLAEGALALANHNLART